MKSRSTSLLSTVLTLALMTMNPWASRAVAQHDRPHAASTTTAQDPVYSCPMHPEVTGKAGDKCSKCGMDMTPVKAK